MCGNAATVRPGEDRRGDETGTRESVKNDTLRSFGRRGLFIPYGTAKPSDYPEQQDAANEQFREMVRRWAEPRAPGRSRGTHMVVANANHLGGRGPEPKHSDADQTHNHGHQDHYGNAQARAMVSERACQQSAHPCRSEQVQNHRGQEDREIEAPIPIVASVVNLLAGDTVSALDLAEHSFRAAARDLSLLQISAMPFIARQFLVLEIGIACRKLLRELCVLNQVVPVPRIIEVERTGRVLRPFAVLVEALAGKTTGHAHDEEDEHKQQWASFVTHTAIVHEHRSSSAATEPYRRDGRPSSVLRRTSDSGRRMARSLLNTQLLSSHSSSSTSNIQGAPLSGRHHSEFTSERGVWASRGSTADARLRPEPPSVEPASALAPLTFGRQCNRRRPNRDPVPGAFDDNF